MAPPWRHSGAVLPRWSRKKTGCDALLDIHTQLQPYPLPHCRCSAENEGKFSAFPLELLPTPRSHLKILNTQSRALQHKMAPAFDRLLPVNYGSRKTLEIVVMLKIKASLKCSIGSQSDVIFIDSVSKRLKCLFNFQETCRISRSKMLRIQRIPRRIHRIKIRIVLLW